MNQSQTSKLVIALVMGALALATSGCQKLSARNQLNKGVQEYKANHFEKAIEHFKNAADLDPNLDVARLYLATACATQYVPGAEGEENTRFADCAQENFKKVLDNPKSKQADRVLAVKGISSLNLNMKKFEEAKNWSKKAIELDPNDPDNYYTVAFADWTQAYTLDQPKRLELGLGTKPNDPIKDKKVCAELREKNWANVTEGIEMLNKALELRKDYDDAMAYMNLLYRQRADLQCDSVDQAMADLKTADDWVQKTMDTKRAKAAKASEQHGIVLDQPQQQQPPPSQ